MARILHILGSPKAEGTPRLCLDWLGVPGHEQAVVFLSGDPPELLDAFRAAGQVLAVEETIVPGPAKFLRMIGAARRHVRDYRPDLVIAWPMGFSHWLFLGARAAGSRAACLSHVGNPPGVGWRQRYLSTWICLCITAFCGGRAVACSLYVRNRYCAIPLVPASIFGLAYNSVRTDVIRSRAEAARRLRRVGGPFRAIMVATLEIHKDHATLIKAAALLKEIGVRIEIDLAGAGRFEARLKAMARDLGVEDVVRFLGARGDIPELLGRSDLFILSTTPQEGRPGVILEALAAGLPIVATDVEPLREVLEGGRWGTLVPLGDAAALARAVADAAGSGPPEPEAVSARQAFAARFTPERMIAAYLGEAGLSAPAADSPAAALPTDA